MSQQVECTTCGKLIALPEDAVGKKVQCGSCSSIHRIKATDGGTLYLQSLDSAPTESDDEELDHAETPVVRARGRRKSKGGRRSSVSARSGPRSVKSSGIGGGRKKSSQKPDSHLALAIVCTLLCCQPLGIAAIIYAIKVNDHWQRGNEALAIKTSRTAKSLAIYGIIGGALLFALVVIAYALEDAGTVVV